MPVYRFILGDQQKIINYECKEEAYSSIFMAVETAVRS